jgi:hypothetical protein
MMTETDDRFRAWGAVLALWAGILIPAFAWAIQMQAAYLLVQRACMSGRNTLLHVVTVVALLITFGAGIVAWRKWQEAGRDEPDESAGPTPRGRFMAVLGLLMSAMFFLVILAQGIASFVLHPCQL